MAGTRRAWLRRALAPASGACRAQSDFPQPHGQQAFWDSSAARLRAVKARHDPDGVVSVQHGIGGAP